jgi:hypothetical protein
MLGKTLKEKKVFWEKLWKKIEAGKIDITVEGEKIILSPVKKIVLGDWYDKDVVGLRGRDNLTPEERLACLMEAQELVQSGMDKNRDYSNIEEEAQNQRVERYERSCRRSLRKMAAEKKRR